MQNRTPVARPARPALPDFAPVPRKYRHDGWTPDRQKAFIEALADTGSVSRAAAMVNMAQANCYTLRRAPGAEEFRKAWEAALDFGLQRLKDVAFERAIEGQLVPVFVGGKLVGFRRMRNDALLMFCLRHYGQDSAGRRTTVNYFSTRADAAAGRSGAGADAAASVTTMRTVTAGARAAALEDGRGQALAAEIDEFAGVALDTQAQASIAAALEACAARARAAGDAVGERALDLAEDDPDESFVAVSERGQWFRGGLIPGELEEATTFGGDEVPWTMAGAEKPMHDWVAPEEAAAVGVLAPPDDGGVAAVKPRPSRRRRADASSGSGPA